MHIWRDINSYKPRRQGSRRINNGVQGAKVHEFGGNLVLRPGPKQIGNERGLNVLDRLANLENSLPELNRRISLLEEIRVSEPNERMASLEEARVSELNRRITSLEEVRISELNGRIALLEEARDIERRRMLLIRASNLEKASGGWFDFRARNERNRLVHGKDIELDLEALDLLRTDPRRYQSASRGFRKIYGRDPKDNSAESI